jgi:Ca2+/Na+ antiporter
MQLSPSGWENFFNVIYFGLALLFSFFVLLGYRANRPRFYGLLFWALFLILCSWLLFSLYSESLDLFLAMKGLKPNENAVRIHLSENLRILVFVVPGVMLAVAANLITQFLNASSPSEHDSAHRSPP